MPVRSLPVAGRHPGDRASPEPTPPRAAERLLGITIADDEWRDSILGDLSRGVCDDPQPVQSWICTVVVLANSGRHRCARRLVAIRRTRVPRFRRLRRRPSSRAEVAGGSDSRATSRHAWRTLARRPAHGAVIVITLAVALATNSTSFAIMDALVLRPFRFPGLDRLMPGGVQRFTPPGSSIASRSLPPTFADWRRESRTLTQLAAAAWWDANLSGIDTPEPVPGFRVTADFFNAL